MKKGFCDDVWQDRLEVRMCACYLFSTSKFSGKLCCTRTACSTVQYVGHGEPFFLYFDLAFSSTRQ